jgi:hypothetical protein
VAANAVPAAATPAAATPAAATPAAATPAAATPAAATPPTLLGAVAAEPTGPVIEAGCTYDAGQLKGSDGTAFRVSCPAGCDKGSVYGTGVYTADTSICRAGVHAGAISGQGGTLTVVLQAGRAAYRGSEQNGIESRDYGKFSRSYAVVTNGRLPPSASTGPDTSGATGATAGSVIEAGCSFDAGQLTGNEGTAFRVACPAGCDSGSVYGTGVYTADTSICRAGVHAGAIPPTGGTLTIQLAAGRPAYRGSEQNGIKSRDYGKYSRSYAVVTDGNVTERKVPEGNVPGGTAPPAAGAATPAGTPAAPQAAGAAAAGTGQVIEAGCSYDARQLVGNDGTSFKVACPAGCDLPSQTYGTGVYTADSPICKSAIHAGAIAPSGGVVTIQLEPGRPAYRGSEQNGIKSRDYGKYSRSYAVVKP